MYDPSDAVIISLIGSGFGLIALFARLLYRSKCDTIDIGCLHIHRNIKAEIRQQQMDSFSDVELGGNSPK